MASAERLLWPLPSFLLELKFSENLVPQLFFFLGTLHKWDQELTGAATTPRPAYLIQRTRGRGAASHSTIALAGPSSQP